MKKSTYMIIAAITASLLYSAYIAGTISDTALDTECTVTVNDVEHPIDSL